ncbi:TetR/AcrR family transcriptional regulator [Nocardia sp. NPDC058379]|uniref:TetR/AcrR family transcriptional regulator n=1 Tax=unclassified Nocardia TaxID=2637762 RepID=UPI003651F0CC
MAAERRLAERTRAQRTEQVRKEIVDAAIVEFIERGYHEASLAHIAERIGTGASTIYRYFASKREILDYAVADTVAALAELLGRANAEPPGSIAEFRHRANEFGDVMADLLTGDPRIAQMMLMVATSKDEELRGKWTAIYALATTVVEDFLSGAVASGFVRADLDAKATAAAIIAIPFGMVACNPDLFADPKAATAAVRATVDMVVGGIRSSEAPLTSHS